MLSFVKEFPALGYTQKSSIKVAVELTVKRYKLSPDISNTQFKFHRHYLRTAAVIILQESEKNSLIFCICLRNYSLVKIKQMAVN